MARKKKDDGGADEPVVGSDDWFQAETGHLFDVLDKKYGKGILNTIEGKHASKDTDIVVFPTGILGLDKAMGIGGLARGRIYEVYGAEASGKTSLALQIIARAQSEGEITAFIDAEHALNPDYARDLKVDLEKLLITQPDSAEDCLEIAATLCSSGKLGVIVVDSVAAMVPKAEVEGEIGDIQPGLQARLMSQALRKLTGIVRRSGVILIFINQTRMKIGVRFGSPVTTSGGKALGFAASARIEVSRVGHIGKSDEPRGQKVKLLVKKNRFGPPYRRCEVEFLYGKGFSMVGEVFDHAVVRGILKKKGSWYSHGDETIAQGREDAVEWLENNPELFESVLQDLLSRIQDGASG